MRLAFRNHQPIGRMELPIGAGSGEFRPCRRGIRNGNPCLFYDLPITARLSRVKITYRLPLIRLSTVRCVRGNHAACSPGQAFPTLHTPHCW